MRQLTLRSITKEYKRDIQCRLERLDALRQGDRLVSHNGSDGSRDAIESSRVLALGGGTARLLEVGLEGDGSAGY